MGRRASWKIDPATGRSILTAESREGSLLAGPRPQLDRGAMGFAAVPEQAPKTSILVGNFEGLVVISVKVGQHVLPLPLTPEQAENHVKLLTEAIAKAKEATCPTESPATDPADCQGPADTASTISTHEIGTPPDSTAPIAGVGSGR